MYSEIFILNNKAYILKFLNEETDLHWEAPAHTDSV